MREARACMAASTGGKKRRRNAKTVEKEDELLDDEVVLTRLEEQPTILTPDCRLRDYQLDSLNWLIGLYETGINGILADEMVSRLINCEFCIGPGKNYLNNFFHSFLA